VADRLDGVLDRLHPQVAGQVVERAPGHHHQRQAVPQRHAGRGVDGPVAPGHPERGAAALGQPFQLVGQVGGVVQLDHLGAG
jgi:hypothetical protein